MSSSTREQMEFPPFEVMMFRDRILAFKTIGRSLGPGNNVLADQLIPGGITQQPYVIVAHLLDHMAETNQEVEKDFMLAALMNLMDEMAKKIVEIEVQCKRKDKYIPLHERKRPKNNEGKRVKGMLSIILHKVNEHDMVLEEMNENIKIMKQMIGSHSRLIQLLENLTGHVMPHLQCKRKDKYIPPHERRKPMDY
uniref:Integrase core domain containing protein n=1 Tax=Solanum tuberosum TaxID=4113 RepID=M1DH77_SOLTU